MLDDELLIETPERVEIHYALASVGNRFLAAFIDHLIQLALMLVIILGTGIFTSWTFFSSLSSWAKASAVLGTFFILWGYFVLFETFWSGQTPGKRIMRLRVIREDGRPVRFFEVLVRNLLRFVIDFQPVPSFGVGVLSIMFSTNSKRVGDYIAGTVVVKERSTEAPSLADVLEHSRTERRRLDKESAPMFRVDTRLLNEKEVRAIQAFLKRRYDLSMEHRLFLANRILPPIIEKLGLSNLEMEPEEILEEIDRQQNLRSRYNGR